MLRFLIPVIMALIGLGAGIGAGFYLSEPSSNDTAAQDDSADATQSGPSEVGTTEFVRLNNQFVVPLVQDGSVRSLIVMALTVEVAAGSNELVYQQEPRLRDAFLRVMFAHANAGGFNGYFTESAAMAPLRSALTESARAILGEVVRDVLIVDITRQDA